MDIKEYNHVYYLSHKERVIERSSKWKMLNPERAREQARNGMGRFRARNPDFNYIQYERHRGSITRYHEIYRLEIKREVFSHYGDVCVCCGEYNIKFLTLDHIDNGRGNPASKTDRGTSFYHRLRRESYPEGYQVLCFNCNCAKGAYGKCPHVDM